MKITGNTTVVDAIKKSKGVVEIFKKYQLDCPGCMGAIEDTIQKVADNNGLDITVFIKELNSVSGGS